MIHPVLPPIADPLVSYPGLEAFGIRYSRVHLRRKIDNGEFPEPVRLSDARIAWRSSDLREWVASRPTGRIKRPKRLHANTANPVQKPARSASRTTNRAA